MPRFSVLLPTHNRAEILPFAIRSVLDQTETDFELLVVGDGCTDGTAAVVAGFDDPRIRWFDLPKAPGFGYANRNVALRAATGDLIAFAAHDDILFPDHLARMGALFGDPNVAWAYSLGLWAMPDGVVVPVTGNLTLPDELNRFLDQGNFIAAQCVVHRRACFDTCGYWPEDADRDGDWILWRRMIAAAGRARLRYLPVPTGLHFRANWRRSGLPAADGLAALAREAPWWPEALKLAVPEGEPEQASFDAAIRAGGARWVEAARHAVTTVCGRLAWERVGSLDQDRVVAALRARIRRLDALSEGRSEAAPAAATAEMAARTVRLVVDGLAVAAEAGPDGALHFRLPPDAADVRLVSPTLAPSGRDVRRLGVLVSGLSVGDGTAWTTIDLDDPGLLAGFHPLEGNADGTWRWTSGEALLSPALWTETSGTVWLRVSGMFPAFDPG